MSVAPFATVVVKETPVLGESRVFVTPGASVVVLALCVFVLPFSAVVVPIASLLVVK